MSPVTRRQKGYHRIRRLHHRFRHNAVHPWKWWNRFLNTSRECHPFCLPGPPLCGTKQSIDCTSARCNPCRAKRSFVIRLYAPHSPIDAVDSVAFWCLVDMENVADLYSSGTSNCHLQIATRQCIFQTSSSLRRLIQSRTATRASTGIGFRKTCSWS